MSLAFKTRSVMLPDVYPPAELRENTKARRAWLQAQAAELASDDIAVKVVGQGSYQHLSVRRLEKIPARVQFRGTCQVCCAGVAVDTNAQVNGCGTQLTSMHGYKRPGNGYIVGQCPGALERPAELDLTLTNRWRAAALADVARLQADAERFAAQYRAAMDAIPSDRPSGWYASEEGKAIMAAARDLDNKSHAAKNKAWHAQNFANDLATYAVPAFGQPLAEVLIAD